MSRQDATSRRRYRVRRHAYAGWQPQPGRPTVQDCVQKALSAVADHPVTVAAAGRTDAGVHACAQVAHFETSADRPVRGWVLGANSHLPPDIAINWAIEVERDFHARYTAQGAQLSLLHAASRDAARDTARSRLLDRARCSTPKRCTRRRRRWSASTTSPRFARSNASRRRRCGMSPQSRCSGDGRARRRSKSARTRILQHMVRNIAGTLHAGRRRRAPAELGRPRCSRPATAPAPGSLRPPRPLSLARPLSAVAADARARPAGLGL